VLVVIGGGPYGIATAAKAIEAGIETVVVGYPLSFWTDNMPADMYLRSGPDWHLDAAQVHTFEAFLDERGIDAPDVDPVPIAIFLDYARWFQHHKHVAVRECLVTGLRRTGDGSFLVALDNGETLAAESVVAAPGVRYFQRRPGWSMSLPEPLCSHTCELVRFDDFAGARVLIVGGRQSAYEWAALAGEHGAETVDIVHRHDVPRFDRVSWTFVDAHVENTINVHGYWRNLPKSEQDSIARQFWDVGRLTLEYWLTPRLDWAGLHCWPGAEVVETRAAGNELGMTLSNGARLNIDHVVFASGYLAELGRVPYLARLAGQIECSNGFPVLDEAFGTSLTGLYVIGFSATQDFGPFFGFVKGCPAAATLVVRDLLARSK